MSGCLRLLVRRSASIADPARQAVWQYATSTVISVRHAARRAARATTAAPRKKKSSTGSPSKAAGAAVTAAASPRAENTAAEDQGLQETDARLSMRLLMVSHFNYTGEATKAVQEARRQSRETTDELLEARQRRLQEKDDNALRLLASDGVSVGDGIIPLAGAAPRKPHAAASAGPGGGGAAAWRALNPIGLAASQAVAAAAFPGESSPDTGDALSESAYAAFLAAQRSRGGGGVEGEGDDGDDVDADPWKSATLATLSKPDLSMYDTDHDFRISSEEALRLACEQPRAEPAAGVHDSLDVESVEEADTATTLLTRPGASRMAAAAMQQKLDEDEDVDYTVAAYSDSADDPFNL